MDLDALREFVVRTIRAQLSSIDRAATIRAVNDDGTVSIDLGDGTIIPSQPALSSYTPRSRLDRVLVRNRGGEYVVQGKVGPPTSIPAATNITISNSSAPGGAGWEEIVLGQLWAQANALWCKRVTTVTPPSGGTAAPPPAVAKEAAGNASRLVTYRGGGITQQGVAEQGDYSGNGMQFGLATFGSGAWSALSGKTITGGVLKVHRSAGGHGFTWGPATVYMWRCAATDPPASPPSRFPEPIAFQLALNETSGGPDGLPVSAQWLGGFASGSYTALAFYSDSAGDNVEIDSVSLTISYT